MLKNVARHMAAVVTPREWIKDDLLELALSAGNVGLFEWDLLTDQVFWSPVTYLIFDVEPGGQPADYRTFRSRLHPDDLEAFERALEVARETRTLFDHHHRIVLPDGRVRFVHGKSKFAYDVTGVPVCLSGVVIDTTAAHELESQLARRDRQFASLVEHSPDILTRLSLDLRHAYVSPAVERYIGLKPEECIGKTVYELGLPPELCDRWVQAMRDVIESRRPASLATSFTTVDGELRALESRIVPELSADGAVESLLVITSDVTQAEHARQTLALSELRFRTLADALPLLAWSADADGFVHWYNRSWYEYTGASEEAMRGWGWQNVYDPAVLPRVLDEWKRCIASAEPFEMTGPLLRADGAYRPFLTRARPVKDAAGKVLQWVGTNTDVSGLNPG